MPQYFFHYKTPDGYTRDDVGCSFASLELAYLDAYRSVIDIGAEVLKRQENPALHRIEIADDAGHILMEISFSEIFQGKNRRSTSPNQLRERQRILLADYRRLRNKSFQLRDDIAAICDSARLSVRKAHELLERARSCA